MLIINADDWGGWKSATDAALECFRAQRITSATAMVFMEDSERAASIAADTTLNIGLHLNFNQPLTGRNCPPYVLAAHERIGRFLRRGKYAQLVYHPGLRKEFRTVFTAQLEEFMRLYGRRPTHFDGHQHMHLCMNALVGCLVPRGERVRRSFSFRPGEKGRLNLLYRRWVHSRLRTRYLVTDYFFSLSQCLKGNRLEQVLRLARTSNVELMTHPEKPDEFTFLMSDSMLDVADCFQRGSYGDLQPI